MRILLCEDDSNIATIARMVLEQVGGHTVQWVSDGESAKREILSLNFDVALLDDMMPKKSGNQVCEEIKASGQNAVPVIFMSANPQAERIEPLRPVAIGYIPKPFDPMNLCSQIDRILDGQKRRAG